MCPHPVLTGHPTSAVLFDLDGTLVDSAPDLYAAACAMRAARGLPRLTYEAFRPSVSRGGRAMLAVAFPHMPESDLEGLLQEFLSRYRTDICVHSRLFDGMAETLDRLEQDGIAWGIVTNKPGWLCQALLAALHLERRCRAVVAGDTLPVRKPDPAPVRAACRMLDVDPTRTVFVGDDRRDIEAGRAAGCRTVVAAWGYVAEASERAEWGADHEISRPLDVLALPWLKCAV